MVVTVSVASFGNEMEDMGRELEGGSSQQGHVVCLATRDFLNAKTAMSHPVVWSSTLIKRVCRSTLMAKTLAMLKGT